MRAVWSANASCSPWKRARRRKNRGNYSDRVGTRVSNGCSGMRIGVFLSEKTKCCAKNLRAWSQRVDPQKAFHILHPGSRKFQAYYVISEMQPFEGLPVIGSMCMLDRVGAFVGVLNNIRNGPRLIRIFECFSKRDPRICGYGILPN